MQVHQTLKRVAEESLTLEDCKFLLSKTGEKQSEVLFENYYKKYHPRNGSLSSYFNKKVMENIGSHIISKKKQKKNQNTNSISMVELPLLSKHKKIVLSQKWEKIIRMTEKQNVVRKGCQFPRIMNKINGN